MTPLQSKIFSTKSVTHTVARESITRTTALADKEPIVRQTSLPPADDFHNSHQRKNGYIIKRARFNK